MKPKKINIETAVQELITGPISTTEKVLVNELVKIIGKGDPFFEGNKRISDRTQFFNLNDEPLAQAFAKSKGSYVLPIFQKISYEEKIKNKWSFSGINITCQVGWGVPT